MAPRESTRFDEAVRDANSFADLLRAARTEVRESTGYEHIWLLIGLVEHPDELRVVGVEPDCGLLQMLPSAIRVSGDPSLEAVIREHRTVVVADARTQRRADTNLVAVDARTVIQMPLLLSTAPFGVFGVGTLGDQGPRQPSVAHLAHLVVIAGKLSNAISRIMIDQLASRVVVASTTRSWWAVWRSTDGTDPAAPRRPWWRLSAVTIRTAALMIIGAGAATWELFDKAQRSSVLMLVAATGLPLLFRLEGRPEEPKDKR